jgi:hypothetical protein
MNRRMAEFAMIMIVITFQLAKKTKCTDVFKSRAIDFMF